MGAIHRDGAPWRRASFEEEEHVFGFGHVGFEVSQRHLSGGVETAIVFSSLGFRRNLRLSVSYHSIDSNWSYWHG